MYRLRYGRSAAYSSGHYQPVEQRPAFTDEGHIILRSRTDGEQWLVKWKTAAAVLIPRNWLKSSSHCSG